MGRAGFDTKTSIPDPALSLKVRWMTWRAMSARPHLEETGDGVGDGQGLTLVHFSAQLEPCPTQENTLHTLHTP